jgi:hypothetical protein
MGVNLLRINRAMFYMSSEPHRFFLRGGLFPSTNPSLLLSSARPPHRQGTEKLRFYELSAD